MDLSVFSPACLPDLGDSFVDQNGIVYGEQRHPIKKHSTQFFFLFVSGWGDTGVQDTSTDKLQETVVPIVDPSSCGEDVDEDLIVCAGGLGVGKGPCKVSLQIILISHDNPG